MKNKVAQIGHSDKGIRKEVGEYLQRVMHRLTSIGPSDQDVEYEIRESIKHIDRLSRLRIEDPEAYEIAIEELQLVASGKRKDPTGPVSQAMAETILLEQGELNTIDSSRSDVRMALTGANEEFMGDDTLIPFNEALARGDMEDDTL